ncbi:MAG: hypothetical protein ABI681_00920 [Gemmatimonadales bacterium]
MSGCHTTGCEAAARSKGLATTQLRAVAWRGSPEDRWGREGGIQAEAEESRLWEEGEARLA